MGKKKQAPKPSAFGRFYWKIVVPVLGLAAIIVLIISLSSGSTNDEHAGHTMESDGPAQTEPSKKTTGADEHAGHDDHAEHAVKKAEPTLVDPEWSLVKSPPVTTEPVGLNFSFADFDSKELITDYELYHEKKMHVIVVSKDLRDFYHFHPEMKEDGKFTAFMDLKRATTYKIFVDARSKSQGWINEFAEVIVRDPEVVANHKDPKTAPPAPPLDPPNLVVNDKETLTIDGKQVSLSTTDLQVGKEAKLQFTFRDAASGADITDLETYLGAVGHAVILSEDVTEYIHTHPLDSAERGPTATFSAVFDKPGKYKMWGEFVHAGKRFVVPYVIDVKP